MLSPLRLDKTIDNRTYLVDSVSIIPNTTDVRDTVLSPSDFPVSAEPLNRTVSTIHPIQVDHCAGKSCHVDSSVVI